MRTPLLSAALGVACCIVLASPVSAHSIASRFPLAFSMSPMWSLTRLGLDGEPPIQTLDATVGTRRTVVELTVAEPAYGLFLEIAGDVEFERADVMLDGGVLHSIDLFGVRRSKGLYDLVQFGDERQVDRVRLVLRSRGHTSHVGVRLAVPAP